jgi:hypothetical protein
MLQVTPSGDITWQLWIARQMLGGARLYTDIWEVNPPLWFWSAVPVEWLGERTGLPPTQLLFTFIVAMAIFSALLVEKLTELPRATHRFVLTLLVFWISIVMPFVDLGQREQLALTTCLPYAALIARRRYGRSTPVWIATAVGIFGAYGFAFKHYFILVPLSLELWLCVGLRRNWRPWRPELVAMVIFAALYAVCVCIFTPAYLSFMVPMNLAAYASLDRSYLAMLKPGWVGYWLLTAAFYVLYRRERRTDAPVENTALFQALLITAGCFAFAYFIQRKIFTYHSVPTSGTLAVATCLYLQEMQSRRRFPLLFGVALLAVPVFTLLTPRLGANTLLAEKTTYLQSVAAGDPVFIGTFAAGWAWPDVELRHLTWISRAYTLWMVHAIARAEIDHNMTPELNRLRVQTLGAVSEDIRCNPPVLLLIERTQPEDIPSNLFTLRDFIFRDDQLRTFVAENYVTQPDSLFYFAYRRHDSVSGITSDHCRRIR